ncbi:YkoP family protein [Povalibacter sp.]|uniref:YkoP family protein n=1 Tax=Povalibacter sp. TaxID=1962978 RepID=UPI002F3E2985
MSIAHRAAQRMLGWVDAWYYRRYRLRTLGPVLFLGKARYRGPSLQFDDGTLLQENDSIGRLHFNNASIAALGEGSMQRVGFRFARLMRESLRQLDQMARVDPSLSDVRVFQGVTWLPAHGQVVGFVSTPLPKDFRWRLLTAHFRLLSWVFAPAAKIRDRDDAEPRLYWLTRDALAKNVGKLKGEAAS